MSAVIVPKSPPVLVTGPAGVDHLPVVRTLARLMDTAFVVPGTRFRFGLDALIDLIPGVGDAVGTAVSTYLVYAAARMGVSKAVIARMLLNVAIDTVGGAVPFAGAVFDAAYKANVKNARLLELAVLQPRATRRSSLGLFLGLLAAVVVIGVGGIALTVWLTLLLLRQTGHA